MAKGTFEDLANQLQLRSAAAANWRGQLWQVRLRAKNRPLSPAACVNLSDASPFE